MTDKEKAIKKLKEVLNSLDITNKYRLNLIEAIEYLQEEPVSENLEEAADKYSNNDYNYFDVLVTEYDGTEHLMNDKVFIKDAFKAGAKWEKENMMKDATECEVKVDAGGYPYIDRCIELYDYDKDVPLAKAGDKYKVVLIKEG